MTTELDTPALCAHESIFICPQTKLPLRPLPLEQAIAALGAQNLIPRTNIDKPPFGVTATMMVRSDNACAYPVVDGVPILLVPEQINPASRPQQFDLDDIKYAEAYQEMTHYNKVGQNEAARIRESQSYQLTEPVIKLQPADRDRFLEPKSVWLDCVPDCKAQYESYKYLEPIKGKRVMQLGGKGIHAVKLLLAGAAEAWLVTPMLGEVYCSIALAREAGVLDRLRCAVGVAEEIPIADATFDGIYSAGCVHHMTTELAMPEIARVLKPGGRFSSFDPWRAPFYALGIKIFGKREVDVFCRPLNKTRVAPLFETFPNAKKEQYGALMRYPMLALSKMGLRLTFPMMWRLYRLDEAVCNCIPGMRNFGSSVALFATK